MSVSHIDKVFQLANGLGAKYQDFRLAMLTKPSYTSFNDFVMSLEGHELSLLSQAEEEKQYLEQTQAYFGQRVRGRHQIGGHNINS